MIESGFWDVFKSGGVVGCLGSIGPSPAGPAGGSASAGILKRDPSAEFIDLSRDQDLPEGMGERPFTGLGLTERKIQIVFNHTACCELKCRAMESLCNGGGRG